MCEREREGVCFCVCVCACVCERGRMCVYVCVLCVYLHEYVHDL